MAETTVLCVGSAETRRRIRTGLADESGMVIVDSASVTEAIDAVADSRVDCVVTEHDLPDGSGVELIRDIRDAQPNAGGILLAERDPEVIEAADDLPLIDYVDKNGPVAEDSLADVVALTADRHTQSSYPLPDEEDQRLAILKRLDFDAPSLSAALHRVVDLGVEHFDVEYAAVNFIEKDTRRALACHGVDQPTVPRRESICTYSILDDGVTVVEDTQSDTRFEQHQGLDERDVRFYAGATLTTAEEVTVGTFCIYDAQPRSFTEAEERYLRLLADEVMHWIALHRQLAGEDGDQE